MGISTSLGWPGIAMEKFDTRFGTDKSLPVRRLDWLDGACDGICFRGQYFFSLSRKIAVAVTNTESDI